MTSGVLRGVERAVTWTTSTSLAASAVYVVLAVVGPSLGLELPDEDLLVSEAVVMVAFLPQLLLVTSDRQLSVDLFTVSLPERAQAGLGVFAQICGILTFALLGWAGWLALDRALDFGSVNPGKLRLPEWPARALVIVGCLGGLAGCVIRLARTGAAGKAS